MKVILLASVILEYIFEVMLEFGYRWVTNAFLFVIECDAKCRSGIRPP